LMQLPLKKMESIRGKYIGMIFQDPMSSLNPTLTIGFQICEGMRKHQELEKKEAQEAAKKLLELVGVSHPERRVSQYPHELSGGIRQRVMIAIALAGNPQLLIADEPTTALDVTVQAQILDLLKEIQEKMGMSLLLITHDLSLVASTCSRTLVMYAGEIIENAPTRDLFASPKHPYTQGLLNSISRLDRDKKKKLEPIPGQPPTLLQRPHACPFHPRCPAAMNICAAKIPPLSLITSDHQVKCWLHSKSSFSKRET
jgi:oligopeptide transport system ATP-binding protein